MSNYHQTNCDLKDIIEYFMTCMSIETNEHREIKSKIINNNTIVSINTRNLDYCDLSHMRATDDLNSSIEFYKTHLPNNFVGKVDDIWGEVGEKGYITICASKE